MTQSNTIGFSANLPVRAAAARAVERAQKPQQPFTLPPDDADVRKTARDDQPPPAATDNQTNSATTTPAKSDTATASGAGDKDEKRPDKKSDDKTTDAAADSTKAAATPAVPDPAQVAATPAAAVSAAQSANNSTTVPADPAQATPPIVVGGGGRPTLAGLALKVGDTGQATTDKPVTATSGDKPGATPPTALAETVAKPVTLAQASDNADTKTAKPAEHAAKTPAADAKSDAPTPATQPDGSPTPVPVASTAQSGPTAAAAAANVAQQQTQTTPPTPISSVPIEVGLQALRNGSSTFEIRLDPKELGRVEVRLRIADSGQVSASLVADRVETLHLLQREAKTLERAFEQAGLKSNSDDLQFSLRRDDGQQQQARADDGAGTPARTSSDEADVEPAAQPVALARIAAATGRWSSGGIDIHV